MAEWTWRYSSRSNIIIHNTPCHASGLLCLIWKESIQKCRCFRADMTRRGDRKGRTNKWIGSNQHTSQQLRWAECMIDYIHGYNEKCFPWLGENESLWYQSRQISNLFFVVWCWSVICKTWYEYISWWQEVGMTTYNCKHRWGKCSYTLNMIMVCSKWKSILQQINSNILCAMSVFQETVITFKAMFWSSV